MPKKNKKTIVEQYNELSNELLRIDLDVAFLKSTIESMIDEHELTTKCFESKKRIFENDIKELENEKIAVQKIMDTIIKNADAEEYEELCCEYDVVIRLSDNR